MRKCIYSLNKIKENFITVNIVSKNQTLPSHSHVVSPGLGTTTGYCDFKFHKQKHYRVSKKEVVLLKKK